MALPAEQLLTDHVLRDGGGRGWPSSDEQTCDTAPVNRGWRSVVGVVVATTVGASLSACGGARVIEAGDVTVLVAERAGGGMDALLDGTLAIVGGCLGITDPETEHATGADRPGTVVVWPHGTDLTSDDPATIALPGTGDLAVGDEVSVGGGFVRSDEGRVGGVTVPDGCDSGEV